MSQSHKTCRPESQKLISEVLNNLASPLLPSTLRSSPSNLSPRAIRHDPTEVWNYVLGFLRKHMLSDFKQSLVMFTIDAG